MKLCDFPCPISPTSSLTQYHICILTLPGSLPLIFHLAIIPDVTTHSIFFISHYVASRKTLIEQQLAEAAREEGDEEVVDDQLVDQDANSSSDEDETLLVSSAVGNYYTQMSIEASVMSLDTSASSTMVTSLDDSEVCHCFSVSVYIFAMCVCPCMCVPVSLVNVIVRMYVSYQKVPGTFPSCATCCFLKQEALLTLL